MKRSVIILFLFLSACAVKPPVQEMSDARSAIHSAQNLPGDSAKAQHYLKSAEQALEEAAEAIKSEHYDKARVKAMEAKRNAQNAARIKQFDKR